MSIGDMFLRRAWKARKVKEKGISCWCLFIYIYKNPTRGSRG